MENKNQKKSFLKRLFSKKAAASVGTAVKVLTSVVLGASVLAGTYGIVQNGVIPTTESKVSSMYDVADDVSTEGSGGVTVPDPVVEIAHNGIIPEGGTYTAANGTVYNAGDNMPSSVSVGDTYTYGDYKYSKSSLSLLEELGYSSVDEFKANCEADMGLTWDECVAEFGSEEALLVSLLENYGWSAELNLNVTDKNQTSYGQILYSINNRTVDVLYDTFRDCRYMTTSPTIPSGVLALNRTFYGCSSLTTSPTMPNNLLAMNYSFYNCTSLVNAPIIPDSVVGMYNTFENCKSLVSVPTIPSNVTEMISAFSGCINLVNIPDMSNATNLTNMQCTFAGCSSLTTAPTIPNSVTNMSETFRDCTSLTTVPVIPSSVTDMLCTFDGCTSLINIPTIPNSVTNMNYTFRDCTSLTTAPTISNSITSMYSTFNGCTLLTTAPTIPNSVTDMTETFEGCISLITAPTIPDSVIYMGGTFSNCTSLTTVPVIPNSVTNMAYTFEGCTSLTTAPTIPNSVTNMRGTFGGCTSLTGNIEINANPSPYSGCFTATNKPITITGSCSDETKTALAATANNGNVTY